jgi:Outer membrane protein beta-barrel domain
MNHRTIAKAMTLNLLLATSMSATAQSESPRFYLSANIGDAKASGHYLRQSAGKRESGFDLRFGLVLTPHVSAEIGYGHLRSITPSVGCSAVGSCNVPDAKLNPVELGLAARSAIGKTKFYGRVVVGVSCFPNSGDYFFAASRGYFGLELGHSLTPHWEIGVNADRYLLNQHDRRGLDLNHLDRVGLIVRAAF